MKKLLALLIAIAMLSVLFVGCGSEEGSAPETQLPAGSESASAVTENSTEGTEAAVPETEATEGTTDATEATASATEPTQTTPQPTAGVEVETEDPNAPANENQEIDFDALLGAS